MERVTFLVEENNERISCMLNPETVVMQRSAGLRPRESLSGLISGNKRGDNPLLFTGGGNTSLELDLVFDVSIPGSSIVSQDVRDITKPIWDLTENHQRKDRLYRPALCRFIWGKCWNIPGVISAVAERLESFSAQGIPRRSWLRLRLVRMEEQVNSLLRENDLWSSNDNLVVNGLAAEKKFIDTGVNNALQSNPVNIGTEMEDNFNVRIDLSAERLTGDSQNWRDIARALNLSNPLQWLENFSPEESEATEQSDTSKARGPSE